MWTKLADFVAGFLHLFQFWTVLMDYEVGVVLRLGRFHRVVGPGLHWVIPFAVEHVISDNHVPITENLPPQSLTTSDDKAIAGAAIVTYGISDVRRFLLEIEGGSQVVIDSVCGLIASEVQAHPWEFVRTPEFLAAVRAKAKRRARRWGVDLKDLQWQDLCRSRAYRLLGHGG